ncbi:MAG TPA: hypothetical protein VMV33_17255 [Rhodocyclaceae bacterium]|nr:hypothetical protein [Rhodocyclaceae bacterium]
MVENPSAAALAAGAAILASVRGGGSGAGDPASVAAQFPAFVSHKVVRAALITQVLDDGCMVVAVDGAPEVKLVFQPGMTARYVPVPGDRWLFYPYGYEALSPEAVFRDGYGPEEPEDRVSGAVDASGLGWEHGIALLRNPDGSMTAHGMTEAGAEVSLPIAANEGALYDLRAMISSVWGEVCRRVGVVKPDGDS